MEFTAQLDWNAASDMLLHSYSNDEEMLRKLKNLPPVVIECLALAHRHLTQFKMEQLIRNIKYTFFFLLRLLDDFTSFSSIAFRSYILYFFILPLEM